MNQTEDLMLPPLPDYKRLGDTSTRSGIYGYTADQMREYAELVRADAREANAFKVTIRNLNGEFDRLMEKHNALHISARRHRDANARLMQAIQKTIDDNGHLADGDNCTLIDLVNAVKEQPAQPERTGWPAGLLQDDDRKLSKWLASKPDAKYVVDMAQPKEQPWVGLTDDEVNWFGWHGTDIRTIEAKLKEKNT